MRFTNIQLFLFCGLSYLFSANHGFGAITFSLTTKVQSSVDGIAVGTANEINSIASGKTSFIYTVGGVSLSMSAAGGSFSTDDFRFGVGSDEQIDDPGEYISFSFDTSGTLDFLAFGTTTLANSDIMILSANSPAFSYTLFGDGSNLPSNTTYSSNASTNWDSSSDQFSFTGNSIAFTPSTVFTLSPSNSGGGLSGISISVIPESKTYALLVGIGALGMLAFHRSGLIKNTSKS